MKARIVTWTLAASALALTYAPQQEARACGGTFCDAGPQQMPVDQTGENILFVMEEGTVEAHVQIQYQGDPQSFAWVVPVMAVPEVEAGSDALFSELLAATVPTFVLNTRFDDCGGGGRGLNLGCSADAADAGSAGGRGDGADEDDWPDPTVVIRGVAGAFEYAVLDGGTTQGVVQWLEDNGYAQDDEAPELLDSYLSKGFLFVAFKLRGGEGVEEIHPVVLRYPGDEPCVPIRLTRIAARDDMGIRAFFLGQERVVPTNFRSVEINESRIDWVGLGSNYEAVVTQAVDAEGSDGHGFVTEYAGPSEVVSGLGLTDPRWDSARFLEAELPDVIDELAVQGLMTCGADICTPSHPLIGGLLERFVPRPVGVDPGEFYRCLECFELDSESWSGSEFAAELEERIIAPAEHAVDVLREHPYLTRLFTTMSPHEMTEDPLFHGNPTLPPVSNVFTATRVNTCEGPDYLEFADGSRLAIANDGSLPTELPAALRVVETPDAGAPMPLVEAEEASDEARAAWNAEQGLVDDSGCNCRSRRHGAHGVGWAALILMVGWWARRPRRRGLRARH